MTKQWLMDARIKTQIERITQEIIETRNATQADLKEFFCSAEMRKRMIEGYDRMADRRKTPTLRFIQDAQTD